MGLIVNVYYCMCVCLCRENEFSYVEGAIKGGTKLFKMKVRFQCI